MSDIAIRVENLAKRYRLGSDAPYHLLSESLAGLARKPLRAARRLAHATTAAATDAPPPRRERRPEFWALNDVSFEVKQGEVLGIIGRNGAGKSTLLKILSRITEPTRGRAVLHGRVGSLLEVGTGFHPELTGRENIYLNGAILGMRRAEVNRKFDEIVAFAELEKFLDTPVKRYSSGMVTRLGFAVAAHLEPEILIVDEVLAVGDVGFQKKCLGKMDDVAKSGRTVLFVSHNMEAVKQLTSHSLWLDHGQYVMCDSTHRVVAAYLDRAAGQITHTFSATPKQPVPPLTLTAGRLTDAAGQKCSVFTDAGPICVELDYWVESCRPDLMVSIQIKYQGTVLLNTFSSDRPGQSASLFTQKGPGRVQIKIPQPLFKVGDYSITLRTGIANNQAYQELEDVLRFQIKSTAYSGPLQGHSDRRPGVLAMPVHWQPLPLLKTTASESRP